MPDNKKTDDLGLDDQKPKDDKLPKDDKVPDTQVPGVKDSDKDLPSVADLTTKIDDLKKELATTDKRHKDTQAMMTPLATEKSQLETKVKTLQDTVAQLTGITSPATPSDAQPPSIEAQIRSVDNLITESRKKNFAVDDLIAVKQSLIMAQETAKRLDALESRNKEAEGYGAVLAKDPNFGDFEALGAITAEKKKAGEIISPGSAYEIYLSRKAGEIKDKAVKDALEAAKKGENARGHDTTFADIPEPGSEGEQKEHDDFTAEVANPRGLDLQ
jgi:chromosome segregation ATPase